MPVNVTDVDEFTDPIVGPADSDPADRTYVMTIAQGLANRTRSLLNDIVYPTQVARARTYLPAELASYSISTALGWSLELDRFDVNADPTYGGSELRLITNVARGVLMLPLAQVIPSEGFLTRAQVLVRPGAARTVKTTKAGDGGRMWMAIYQITAGFAGGIGQFASEAPFSSPQEDDGTTDVQVMDTGTIAGSGIPMGTKDGTMYALLIGSGDDSHTNRDMVGSVRLSWTDPGPRNL